MSTPEAVKQYLADKNINSLLKWVTTELVIHKPEDPISFIHNLTKIILSGVDYRYSIENIEELILNARKKSDEDIEKESAMLNERISINSNIEQEEIQGLNKDFSKIVDSMREIATELDPKKASQIITAETCDLLQCERSILYTFDAENEVIIVNSEESLQEMKFPANKGIIGRCIENGKFEIIDNVLNDKDYDDRIDKILNIETFNLLCCPLKDFETGEVYGIIEAINKKNDNKFSKHDVDLLNALGTIGQITIQNGIIYEMAATEKVRNEAMLALWSHLNDESKVFNINSLLFTITRRCLEIVDAEKCTFYFVDNIHKELWSMQGEVNIRMALDTNSMAGLCATSRDIVNEENVYKNQQFNKGTDEKTGFVTKSMLCVPMKGSENKVIGVIQLINKKGMIQAFDQNDEQILQLVLSAAAPIVEHNHLFSSVNDKSSPKKDEKFVNDLMRPTLEKRTSSMTHDIGALVEEEQSNEEEEDEEEKLNEK